MELVLVESDEPVGLEVLHEGGDFHESTLSDLVSEVNVLVDEFLCT